ncbi:hypothetical protein [Actinomadura craniellae]|uniref:hypothetical protein n=1 Tax=Actinomadura craniellae TaxID=2231787 RepID=UPI001F17D9FB|nr:hypothetical protein [Actinomadura craniellae]
MDLYVIELEPEVEAWLDSLNDREYGRVLAYAEILAEEAATLGEPYSRHLGDRVRGTAHPIASARHARVILARTGQTGHPAHRLQKDPQ